MRSGRTRKRPAMVLAALLYLFAGACRAPLSEPLAATAIGVRTATAVPTQPAPAPGVRTAPPTAVAPPPMAAALPAPAIPAAPPASATARPVWLFYGDSLTWQAFATSDGFPAEVRNAGIPGATSRTALLRLDETLAASPDARVVGLAFGTNDALRTIDGAAEFGERMRLLARRVREGGREPVIARVPWAEVGRPDVLPAFNQAIAAIEAELGLSPGPDLYAWFAAHREQIARDGIHMTDEGYAAIRRLWAEALARHSQSSTPPL